MVSSVLAGAFAGTEKSNKGVKENVFTKEEIRRFWEKVDIRGQDECWNWLGWYYKDKLGNKRYGGYTLNRINKRLTAHRFIYLLVYGYIPAYLEIMHLCNNKQCVNPNHLEAGTHRQNIQDAQRDGLKPVGENASNTKLAAREVKTIRKLYATKKYTQRELAKQFSISQRQINRIVNYSTWKHLQ